MTMILDGTQGGTFPSWTTAGRPASPVVGQIGYNSTLGNMEAYTSGGWVPVGLNSGVVTSSMLSTTDWARSLSTTGYQKLPGGLIIQWQSYRGGATSGTITFPIAFPTAVMSIQASYDNTASQTNSFAFNSVGGSTSSIDFWNSALTGFNWLAIGY